MIGFCENAQNDTNFLFLTFLSGLLADVQHSV